MEKLNEYLEYFTQRFSEYSTKIVEDPGQSAEFHILNPQLGKNIIIDFSFDEFSVYFSYQHKHFREDQLMDLEEFIRSILAGDEVVMEIFNGDKNSFGGSLPKADLDLSSVEGIINSLFTHKAAQKQYFELFKTSKYRLETRNWDGSMDYSIALIWDGSNYITVNNISSDRQKN